MPKSPTFHDHRRDSTAAEPPDQTVAAPAQSDDDLLVTDEMAAYLHCSPSYLHKLRCYGGGPPFIRLSPRKVLYRRGDGRAWARARRFNSTSEYKK